MLYAYSRDDIVRTIRDCECTSDGIYWCPYVWDKLMREGLLDDSIYAYKREMFEKKMYFTENDIDLFLSEKKIFNLDELNYYNKSKRFSSINDDLKNLSIYDYVPNKLFTLEELLDCYEYII